MHSYAPAPRNRAGPQIIIQTVLDYSIILRKNVALCAGVGAMGSRGRDGGYVA